MHLGFDVFVRGHPTYGRTFCLALYVLVLLAGCGGQGPTEQPAEAPACGAFGDWETSPYVLPYPVGRAFVVAQGNCSGFGHGGFWTFGYDFIMDVGTVVTAAREGTVEFTQDGTRDGDESGTNLVTVRHPDGTVALYSHLTLGGVLVQPRQRVEAGDTIGLSGNTGNTGGLPHLHFSVHPCGALPGLPGVGDCPSQPVNFRNTEPNPYGLATRRSYRARPFE